MDNKRTCHVVYILLFLLYGFIMYNAIQPECISTETTEVEVKITDKYYMPCYVTYIYMEKFTSTLFYPARYLITVEYNGNEYIIYGEGVYKAYSDKIGQTAIGLLETKTYDDGSVKYNIISIKY